MQKKVLFSLVLGLLLVAGLAGAQTPEPVPDYCMIRADVDARLGLADCGEVGDQCLYEENQQCGVCCLLATVLYVTDWIFLFLVVLVLALVLIGAFNILTAAGDPGKIEKGRNYIMWAAIGLAVALLTRAVPAIVKFLVAPSATTG